MTKDRHASDGPVEPEERSASPGWDVTERKRLENALQESEKKYRTLFYQAADGIIAMSTDGKLVIVNDSFARMHGYDSPQEMENLHLPDLDTPETARLAPERLRRILNGETLNFEVDHYHKDGHVFPLSVTCNIVKIDGKPFFLGFHRDISERKKTEAALANVQKMESLGLLAGGIAHDFNNILTTVVGSLTLLRSGTKLSAEDQELITEADAACRTAIQLARQLLTFSTGGSPLVKVLDLRPLIRQTASFATRGSNARCVFDLGELPLAVKIDSDQFVQVIQNLIINAAQAMPKGGHIIVSASLVTLKEKELPPLAAGRYVQVRVQDQGIGILPAHLNKIFDPYFSTKPSGRGLGLAVCHSILTRHAGHISAESQPGAGAAFIMHLPASDAAAVVAENEPRPLVPGSGRILLMDDDARLSKVFKRMLKHLGYEADSVESGMAALETYRQAIKTGKPYDAVILDLTVPDGMGGKETVVKLKELDPEVKAIVSTGYSDSQVAAKYSAYGFCAVLLKPYRMEDVSNTLRRVIGAGRG
jgi:PAS domain S-box-containing protein